MPSLPDTVLASPGTYTPPPPRKPGESRTFYAGAGGSPCNSGLSWADRVSDPQDLFDLRPGDRVFTDRMPEWIREDIELNLIAAD